MCGNTEQPNPINWRLYHLLELEQPVTAKQVQWTFRKVTLRHHFYQAYLVLSDASCKMLYDALGEDALGFIFSGSWGPLICCLGSKASIILYFIVTFLSLLALLLFFVFWGLSGDGYIVWPWVHIGAPLCFFVILMVVVTLIASVVSLFWKSSLRDEMHLIERLPSVCNFITAICYAIFTFFMVNFLAKDGTIVKKNAGAFVYIPMVGDIIYYLGSLVWRWPVSVRLQMEYGLNRPASFLSYGFFFLAFIYCALSIAQWLLIGYKIDKKLNTSWYFVYLPLGARALFRVIEAFMRSMVKRTTRIKTVIGVVFDTLGAFFFNGMWVVSLYFILVHITRGRDVVPLLFALIPIYAILLYLLFAMFFTLVYLLRFSARNEREERLNNLKWTPTELPTDEQSSPLLFHNINADNEADDWDAIDDDWSSVLSPKDEKQGSDYYDDIDSGEEEEIFRPSVAGQHPKTPYGASFPPDIGVRPYTGSNTPSTSEIPGKVGEQKPLQQEEILQKPRSLLMPTQSHEYHDPYNFAKPTAPHVDTHSTEESEDSDEDYGYFEGDPYNQLSGVNNYEVDDGPIIDDMSSSASSSAVFSESLHSPKR